MTRKNRYQDALEELLLFPKELIALTYFEKQRWDNLITTLKQEIKQKHISKAQLQSDAEQIYSSWNELLQANAIQNLADLVREVC